MVGQDVTVLGDDKAAAAANLDLVEARGFERAFDGRANAADEPDEDCGIGGGSRALGRDRRLREDGRGDRRGYHEAGPTQAATDELHRWSLF